MKTNVYIDGFNLYFGCLKGTPHKWLDLASFWRASFPPPRNQIHRVRYFTAHVNARTEYPFSSGFGSKSICGHCDHSHLTIHLGSYLEKPTRMPLHPPPATGPKTVQVMKSEEKGSDVNIATYLLVDAFDDEYETAVVVTNDSDLAEPIRLVRQKFKKKVLVLHPCRPGRNPASNYARWPRNRCSWIPRCCPLANLPGTLTDAHGTIHKPATW